MENLWPNDLITERERHTKDGIEDVLVAQAVGVSGVTGGLVRGILLHQSIAFTRSWVFQLEPLQQPSKRAELFVVRSRAGRFPVIIENYDPNVEERFIHVDSLSALCLTLKKLFSSPLTRRVVRALAKEATDANVDPHTLASSRYLMDSQTLAAGQVVTARPIAIGGQISTENCGDMFHVALLGIVGFLSRRQLEALLTPIGRKESPIEPLHDKFVVTVKFIDPIKMTLSIDELRILQSEVRKAIATVTPSIKRV